jgi:hypothetical protein
MKYEIANIKVARARAKANEKGGVTDMKQYMLNLI